MSASLGSEMDAFPFLSSIFLWHAQIQKSTASSPKSSSLHGSTARFWSLQPLNH
ncbi:hypothetical protein PRUPE_4G252500 [Prunus persica]|uniref:Uncharacterized protein n=1 Tax=Prunus persica TaxID=3760 RepID=A0A251PQQ3_PRUPE|nr:hypothetical protein PRUPE_4G252500 [Prunus persica]